jgi:hypothetical protein
LNQILYRGAALPANGKPDTSLAGGPGWRKSRQGGETWRAAIGLHHTDTQRVSVKTHFKGNKSSLPTKTCMACGREMTWRRAWRNNWDEVRYCSDACRRKGAPHV